MRSRICKSRPARMAALALAMGALAPLATAPSALAIFGTTPQPPAVGQNCQLDGKISGRGSTFQENLVNEYAFEFQQDVCGPVGNASNLQAGFASDPAGTTGDGTPASANQMVTYNYTGDSSTATGSGNGQMAISCRSDMFGGSDLPYFETLLGQMNAAPGTLELAKTNNPPGQGKSCPAANGSGIIAPYLGPAGGSYPSVSGTPPSQTLTSGPDATDPVESIPIGGGPIEIGVNLPSNVAAGAIGCTGTAPTSLSFTAAELDGIFKGTINQWNDPALVATNGSLSTDGCSGNIQRVVRADNSGSTEILMEYLFSVDSSTLCGTQVTATWSTLGNFQGTGASNTTWPAANGTASPDCVDGSNNAALPVVTGTTTGTNALLAKLAATPGGIGYGELGDWNGRVGTTTVNAVPGHIVASLQTNASIGGTPAFLPPTAAQGNAADCNLNSNGLPGSGSFSDAIGLNSGGANWATDAATPVVDITKSQTTSYPLCGLTFDFVLERTNTQTGEVAGAGGTAGCTGSTVITGACQAVQGPLQGMTNDQMRTMYAFYSYMLTPAAQVGLNAAGYDQIPAPWLSLLRQGFQNFY